MPIRRTRSPVDATTVSPSTTRVIVRTAVTVVAVVGAAVVLAAAVVVAETSLVLVVATRVAVVGAGEEPTVDEEPHPTRVKAALKMSALRLELMPRTRRTAR